MTLCIKNKNFVVNRGMIVSASKNEEVTSYTFGSGEGEKDGWVTVTSSNNKPMVYASGSGGASIGHDPETGKPIYSIITEVNDTMTKIPTVRERYEEKFGWAGSAGTFTGIRDEEIVKFIIAEREAGAREAEVEKYQAISKIMNSLLSSRMTNITKDIYGYRDRADSQLEALTPPTK